MEVGKINNVTIKCTPAGKCFAVLNVEFEPQPRANNGGCIGIDVGIKDLAVCSNGMTFKNINKSKEVRRLKKSLKRKQRQCSRKYDFKLKMKYKCEFCGIDFVEADRYYPSSKLCSCCGSIKKDLKLKDRVYKCSCGLSIDRDLNASINLSKYKLA